TANSLDGAFCCGNGVVSSAHGNAVAEEVVSAAVKLHADRLLVHPLEAPLVVPSFVTGSVCSLFTVPGRSVVRNVAGVRGCSAGWCVGTAGCHAGGWPSHRWRHEHCPAVSFYGRLATRIAEHLMAHAVGVACPHMAGRSTVRNVAGVRGGAQSVVVHSTTAAMAVREHYDCDDIDGMEQPDDDGDWRTLESQRWRRHARDEWMARIGCAGDCTELKLAALAALGYMRVSRGMAEPMRWCGKLGCALQQQRNALQ
ncbi:surface protease GP63, putative, partial [Trypanosoma cruzi marinkellei]